MIIWFSGRSMHMVRIKNKPTPEGYKILSLCDAGYTYTATPLVYSASITKFPNIEESSKIKQQNTRSQVKKLVRFNNKNDNNHATKWYVTNNFELSLLRLSPDGHLPE
ncbi:21170_t:CDS:2, partial [Gigaspora rosea]